MYFKYLTYFVIKPTPCHFFLKLLENKGLLLRHYTQVGNELWYHLNFSGQLFCVNIFMLFAENMTTYHGINVHQRHIMEICNKPVTLYRTLILWNVSLVLLMTI